MNNNSQQGLYRKEFEHDACGIGFVASMKGIKSNKIVQDSIKMLIRMDHRGATGSDPNSGDGAGVLLQLPHEFFIEEASKLSFTLPSLGYYGVGMAFFPSDETLIKECKEVIERKAKKLGLPVLGYRVVPVNNTEIQGADSGNTEPSIQQLFIERPDSCKTEIEFERKLYIFRQYVSKLLNDTIPGLNKNFYFASLSCRTIIYKGMLTTMQVPGYFQDLHQENFTSALAIVHSRFSTNTFPEWKLAQPFRFIAHNGEINTVKGNSSWMQAQSALFSSKYFTKEELDMILPVCSLGQSDSAILDNAIEILYLSGRSLPHVMMMLIPEAWDGNESMEQYKKDFYEYHASLMEPWDGPASISFTDGKMIGATLDRNGLRPSRFWVTNDDHVIMASEAGVLDLDPATIVKKGRLQPGKMFVVDMEQGRIIPDEELKEQICQQQPYGEWLKENKIRVEDLPDAGSEFKQPKPIELISRQQIFGFTTEDIRIVLAQMVETGKEALGSMGIDTPLAVLSDKAQHLSSYFKQLFAQVTNPPIDPIRERMVMSLLTDIGGLSNLLEESPSHCRQIEMQQPVLRNKEVEKIRWIDHANFQTKTIHMTFNSSGESGILKKALDRICQYAEDAVDDGYSIILLTDRGIDSSHAPIPSLLALGAVHNHLIRTKKRAKVGIILEAGDVWESHHFATLIGYGASAVNPYMAFETIRNMKEQNLIDSSLSYEKLEYNYIKAVNGELLKIFSKMGISTLQSYQGAQIFEILGISKDVVDNYFTGSISRINGIDLDTIAKEALIKHKSGYSLLKVENPKLEVGGIYQWKQRGEEHLFNPQTIHLLQQATKNNSYTTFKNYSKLIDDQSNKAITLRGLMKFKSAKSISIDEVEPIENILKRFATGAMSFGSISYEAHTTLAIAMNRIGGKSNTGEGGEDPIRFEPMANGDSMNSAIKQVASGRFGVTANYLTNAKELQIKMAQGAKPGEGGQLPGHKVDDWIGKTRHSTPGVGLISPPPHHDIYSIEDLAQLIFDLKNANRAARISVKLVSEAGVGTVAAGVAKAHADHILIAGYDGGTGASPLSSIRHAGLPWELGLAETHQTLVKNKLRGRVTIQTDGQIKTGKDLAVAALLGAEEFGVATAALVTAGCIMMRKCHLNTCPVGVATQNPDLRALYTGNPDHVVNLFHFLAQELREIMADLGFKKIEDMIGRVDMLETADLSSHWKFKHIDLNAILSSANAEKDVALFKSEEQDHGLEDQLDWEILKIAKNSIEKQEKTYGELNIINVNRTVGTILSNEVTKKYGEKGLAPETINIKFKGTAGQSFGAFSVRGIKFEIEGDANDYIGKGLCGAKLVVYPAPNAPFKAEENSIVGNVSFYGATSGEAYLAGMAGERFCVRNSGAKVVVEGIGDHGCEYMTGGLAIILGETGRNFGAGMSGGVAYIFDEKNNFEAKVNREMVEISDLNQEDINILNLYLQNHVENTKSVKGKYILDNFKSLQTLFKKVLPVDYKNALAKRNLNISEVLEDKNKVYQDIKIDLK
ncbi:glutamate synthase large subunit [Sandaracinomonas limnophila]|uniref:Glutamate synthase [NADPH] large chain n=1 Tax=Sandaracinomonas limnophila TaxID=1862386 RepID=A0A437PWT3_9BACT|nr:glutamate synthase large subunit [Sandaracinomonas limnophila]RVU26713.1 glutamate synthase large subunit [Sandaracinomonas limnophila]